MADRQTYSQNFSFETHGSTIHNCNIGWSLRIEANGEGQVGMVSDMSTVEPSGSDCFYANLSYRASYIDSDGDERVVSGQAIGSVLSGQVYDVDSPVTVEFTFDWVASSCCAAHRTITSPK